MTLFTDAGLLAFRTSSLCYWSLTRLFIASFSPSIPPFVVNLWRMYGGEVAVTDTARLVAARHFCNGIEDPWCSYLSERAIVVFHPGWILNCINEGMVIPVSPFILDDTFIADNDAYTHTLPPSQSPFRSPLTRLRSDINELEELDISYEQSHSNDDGEAQDGGDDFAKHPSTYVSSPDQNHIINAHATEVSSSSVDISGRTLVNKILDQPRSPSQPPAGFLDSKDHGVGDRPAIMLSHQDKTELSSISRIQHKPLLGRSTSDKENSQPHRNSPFVRLLIQDSPRARSPSPPVVFPRGLYHIHQYTARMRTNFQISQYLPSPSSRDICRQKRPAELLIQLQNKRPRWDTQVSGESLGGAETSARLLGCPKDEADHLTSCSRPFLPNVSVASTLASIARSGRSSFAHIVAGLNCIEVEETLPFSTGYVAHKRAFQRIDTKTKYRRSR